MSTVPLRSGDRVLHPMFGFGVIEGLTTHDREGQATAYYGVRLADGSVLSLPVARAEAVGLRLVVNGLGTIVASLRSPAHPLPDDARQRMLELNARWHAAQPAALAQAVRDLLGYSQIRKLTSGDKKWLTSACERLSAEAAMVDGIDLAEARSAIQQEIDQLKPK